MLDQKRLITFFVVTILHTFKPLSHMQSIPKILRNIACMWSCVNGSSGHIQGNLYRQFPTWKLSNISGKMSPVRLCCEWKHHVQWQDTFTWNKPTTCKTLLMKYLNLWLVYGCLNWPYSNLLNIKHFTKPLAPDKNSSFPPCFWKKNQEVLPPHTCPFNFAPSSSSVEFYGSWQP